MNQIQSEGVYIQPYPTSRPVLFIDMDQTVRRSKSDPKGFIKGPDDIELMPGIEDILWMYRQHGFVIVGVSNQGGVAHGHKTDKQNVEEMQRTMSLFKCNPFYGVKWCYFMEDGRVPEYTAYSMFRKPNIGMLIETETELRHNNQWNIDWRNSMMVGDRAEDEGCAANAKIEYYDINNFLSARHVFNTANLPDMPKNMKEAVNWVLNTLRNLTWISSQQLPVFNTVIRSQFAQLLMELSLHDKTSDLYASIAEEYKASGDEVIDILLAEVHRSATTMVIINPNSVRLN